MLDPVPRIPSLPYPPRHHLQAPARSPMMGYNFQSSPLPPGSFRPRPLPRAPHQPQPQPQPQHLFRKRHQHHQQPHVQRSLTEYEKQRTKDWDSDPVSQQRYPRPPRQQYTKYTEREPKLYTSPTPDSTSNLGQREEIRVYMGSDTENDELGPHDVVVVAGGRRFIQDRTLLSNASPVFERLLRPNSDGQLRDKVIVDGVDAERMKLVLSYMRRRRLKICCPDTALAMLEPAQRFLLDSLTDSIEKYLLQNVPPENYCELYRYSDARGLGVLRSEFLHRIASDMSRFARGPAFTRLEIRLVELLVQNAARSATSARTPHQSAEHNLAIIEAITRWLLAGRRNFGDKLLSGFSNRRSTHGDDRYARQFHRNTHDLRHDDGATPWRGIHPGRRNQWRPEIWQADDEVASAMGSEDARSRYVPDGDVDSVIGSEDSRGQSSHRGGWNVPWRSGGPRDGSEEGSENFDRRNARSQGPWGMPWRDDRNEDEGYDRRSGGGGWRGGDDSGSARGSAQGMSRAPPRRRGPMSLWSGAQRPDDDDVDGDFESVDGDDRMGWLREGFANLQSHANGRNRDVDDDSALGSDDSFEQQRRGMGAMGGTAPWRDRSEDGGSVHSGRSRRSGGMSSRGGSIWSGGRHDVGDNFAYPSMIDDRFGGGGSGSAYSGSRRGSSRGGSRHSGSVAGGSRHGRDDESESDSSDSNGEGRIVQREGWKAAGGECGNCLLRGRHDFRTGWMNREELVDENRTHYEERLFRVVKLDALDDSDLDRVRALADANGLAFLHELTELEDAEREEEEREHAMMGGALPAFG